MADSENTTNQRTDRPRRVSAAGRQDGDYTVEITGAKGGPIPEYRPFGEAPKATTAPPEKDTETS